MAFLVDEQALDLGALFVGEHSIRHALLHGLGGREHRENWDILACDGVVDEALEDGELVEHVQHEQVKEIGGCVVCKVR